MPLIDPRYFRLDDVLRRPYTPQTPFGATGDCVWATSPQGWGFAEGVHWVHKTGEKGLSPFPLSIRADGEVLEPADAVYRPSHVTLHALGTKSGLQVTEDKFITSDDVVVSVLSLRNPNDTHIAVRIDHTFGISSGSHEFRPGIPVWVYREGPPGDDLRVRISAFGARTLVFAVGFGKSEDEARRRVWRWRNHLDPVRMQQEEYQEWFDRNIPGFDCSDPWFTKMWYHRWYLVKKNYTNPGMGTLLEDTFVGGRWNSLFQSATNLKAAGNVLREIRWLRDSRFAQNYFRGFARNQGEDGRFRSFFVDRVISDEENHNDAVIAGACDVHLVYPHLALLPEKFFADRVASSGAEISDGSSATYESIEAFCRAQFEEGDYQRPYTPEIFDTETGKGRTDEREQFTTTWADLILTKLIGIVPRTDDVLEICPLLPPNVWTHFCVENVPYHGYQLTLVWDDPENLEDAYDDGDKGFTVYVDGYRLYHQEDLAPFQIPLSIPQNQDDDDFFDESP